MALKTINLVVGIGFIAVGIIIILLSGGTGVINDANLVVGSIVVIGGLVIAVNEGKAKASLSASSNEKNISGGKHVTHEEEVVCRTIKDETKAVV